MSKTNDTPKLRTLDLGGDATFTVRELHDDELENVHGGSASSSNGAGKACFHDFAITH